MTRRGKRGGKRREKARIERPKATSKKSSSRPKGLLKKVERNLYHNSAVYVNSLFDPFGTQHVRIPEPTPMASQTLKLFERVSVPILAGSGSGYAGGICVVPKAFASHATITALTSTDSGVAMGNASDMAGSSFLSNYEVWRVVSYGLRVVDTGALLNKGVFCLAGQICEHTPVTPSTTNQEWIDDTPLTKYSNAANFKLFSTNEDSNIEMAWHPVTLQPMVFVDGTTTSNIELTGAAYKAQLAEEKEGILDNRLILYFYTGAATAPTDNITVEIVMNIEGIPKQSTRTQLEPQAVEGSPGDTADALSVVLSKVKNNMDWFSAGIMRAGGAAFNGFTKVLRSVAPQNVNIALGMYTGASGASGKLLDSKVEEHPDYSSRYISKLWGPLMVAMREERQGFSESAEFHMFRVGTGRHGKLLYLTSAALAALRKDGFTLTAAPDAGYPTETFNLGSFEGTSLDKIRAHIRDPHADSHHPDGFERVDRTDAQSTTSTSAEPTAGQPFTPPFSNTNFPRKP